MNRFRVWGVAVALGALAIGTAAPALAADPPVTTTDDRPWYVRLFVRPPAQNGPVASNGAVIAAPGVMRAGSTLSPERVAEAQKAEYAAWERRMDVCLKLREAAAARNDDALLRQVDELERQVNALLQQRVSTLGVPKTKAPLPPAAAAPAVVVAPSVVPDKPLDPRSAAATLVAPAQPVPVGGTASLPPAPAPLPEKPYREVGP